MRVGTVCYATDQGLGMLAKSFYDAGVITDPIVYKHRSYQNHPEWYPRGTPYVERYPLYGPAIHRVLQTVDVMLFFETPFDWSFPDRCRAHGVRTVMMPMYEWSLMKPPHVFDKYLCPSLLDVEYFPGNPLIIPPVDPSRWQLRTKALHFVHNAGHIGHRNHKGTEELLKATPLLRKEIKLTIRCQNHRIVELANRVVGDVVADVRVLPGEVSYEDLFQTGDVYVAPEKFNGLSLPLQEAYSAGMLVMTSNRYPANQWLPVEPLIPVKGYHTASIASQYFRFQEAEVTPESIAETMNDWYGRDIESFSLSGRQWAIEHSWEASKEKILQELST